MSGRDFRYFRGLLDRNPCAATVRAFDAAIANLLDLDSPQAERRLAAALRVYGQHISPAPPETLTYDETFFITARAILAALRGSDKQ